MQYVSRKKQFNTGVQALAFSGDGQILFSSAGQKETAVSSLLVNGEQIISVEFGGFSSCAETTEGTGARNDDLGGDIRIMGIDVLDCVPCWEPGCYLVALVLSDSNIKVLSSEKADDSCTLSIDERINASS
jgi:hypothetical protein